MIRLYQRISSCKTSPSYYRVMWEVLWGQVWDPSSCGLVWSLPLGCLCGNWGGSKAAIRRIACALCWVLQVFVRVPSLALKVGGFVSIAWTAFPIFAWGNDEMPLRPVGWWLWRALAPLIRSCWAVCSKTFRTIPRLYRSHSIIMLIRGLVDGSSSADSARARRWFGYPAIRYHFLGNGSWFWASGLRFLGIFSMLPWPLSKHCRSIQYHILNDPRPMQGSHETEGSYDLMSSRQPTSPQMLSY